MRLFFSLIVACGLAAAIFALPDSARAQDAAPSEAAPPAALGLSGVHPAWRDFEPEFIARRCPFDGEYDPEIVSCGTVMVPEDRTDPGSALIGIALMRVAALSDAPAGQAIVRLRGGPGAPHVVEGLAAYMSRGEGDSLRALGEIIYFDQRGIGASDRRFCRGLRAFYQFGAVPSMRGRELELEERQACMARAEAEGIPIAAYNNWSNALDVRDLRRALGYDQWNLYGISYGSQLGLGVMMVDPEGVRAAVLDSIVPTTSTFNRAGANGRNFEQAMGEIAAACAAQEGCNAAYPDLAERFYSVIEDYGRDPVVIDGLDERDFTDGEVLVDQNTIAGLIFLLLYNRELYADLPLLLDAVERRDADALRAYVGAGARPSDFRYGNGMSFAITCSSQRQRTDEERAEMLAEFPRSQPWFHTADGDCEGALALPLNLTARTISSDIPTLVVTGRADPITPWQDGAELAERLTNATYVEFPYTGHGGLSSNEECGDAILAAFITDPAAELDTSCAAETSPPAFVTDWRATDATYRLVTQVQDGRYPYLGAVWLVILLGAVIFFPFAAILRLADSRREKDVIRASGTRLAIWGGALFSVAGLGIGAWLVSSWIGAHPLGLPVGVPGTVIWGGLLSLAGVILAAWGAWKAWKARSALPFGTLAASALVLLASIGLLVFMTGAGIGPIAA